MKNYQFRKSIAISTLLIFTLMTSTVLATGGQVFKDMDQSSVYAREAISELAENNIIQGSNGNFNPTQTINRAEMITMIVRALEIDTENLPETATFKDVSKEHWAFKYVEAAYREGITEGISANEFGKDIKATREQMAAMFIRSLGVIKEDDKPQLQLSRVANLVDAEEISDWAKNEVELTLASGLMVGMGDNSFGPKGNAKREQMAVVIHRLVNNQESILEKIIETITPQELQHPALYNALVKSQNSYKGEMQTTLNLSIADSASEESFTMTMDEISKVNNKDVHSVGNSRVVTDGMVIEEPMETIYVDGILYMKNFEDEVWLEMGEFPLDTNKINENFLLNFNKCNITNDGEIEIQEETVTKYTLRLTFNDAMSMLPDELSGMYYLLLDEHDIEQDLEDLEYIFEIYVNEDEQVIKLVYSLDMAIEEEGQVLELAMVLTVEYKNIGAEYIITAPEDAILIDFDDFDFDFNEEDFDF